MKYRGDIDGLRAIAVLSVVIFHLDASVFGFRVLPGGFTGVDVFFVISGYLITQLIHGQISAGSYSITEFYVRRARRIFPALFFMMAVSAIFVVAYCLPSIVDTFEESLIAATLFFSNIYFYMTADYFAPAAETQPLLHTWSLAVEEQFYIFFPLILLLLRRFSLVMQRHLLLGLAALSLVVSTWLLWVDASAAFYLLISRAWELLLGSLLAIGILPSIRHVRVAEATVAVGLTLIAASVFLLSDETPFPGPAALLPCLGAVLVIHGGAHAGAFTNRILAFGPVRFVGLISYSLYLWHWPIFVLMQFMGFWYMWEADTRPYKLAALGLAFLMAGISWYAIEQPFRHKAGFKFGDRKTLAGSAIVMLALVLSATALSTVSAQFWNLPRNVERVLAAVPKLDSQAGKYRTCFLTSRNDDLALYDRGECLDFADDRKNYIVIGDSQANDLMAGLTAVNPDINFLQATASGCKPVVGQTGAPRCRQMMDMIFSEFLPNHEVDGIVLSARWDPDDLPYLRKTLRQLSLNHDNIAVFGPRVEYKHDLPWVLAVSMLQNNPSLVDRNRKVEQRKTDELFGDQLAQEEVKYFSVYRALCTAGVCRTTDDNGTPLAFDYGHFTKSGSVFIAKAFRTLGGL